MAKKKIHCCWSNVFVKHSIHIKIYEITIVRYEKYAVHILKCTAFKKMFFGGGLHKLDR